MRPRFTAALCRCALPLQSGATLAACGSEPCSLSRPAWCGPGVRRAAAVAGLSAVLVVVRALPGFRADRAAAAWFDRRRLADLTRADWVEPSSSASSATCCTTCAWPRRSSAPATAADDDHRHAAGGDCRDIEPARCAARWPPAVAAAVAFSGVDRRRHRLRQPGRARGAASRSAGGSGALCGGCAAGDRRGGVLDLVPDPQCRLAARPCRAQPRTWPRRRAGDAAVGALGLASFWAWSAASGNPFAMPWGPTPARFVALMLAIGLLASWLGTLCWNEASQRLPTTLAGQLIVFETLAALPMPSCCAPGAQSRHVGRRGLAGGRRDVGAAGAPRAACRRRTSQLSR